MTRLKPLAIGVLFVTLLGCQNTTPSNQEAPLYSHERRYLLFFD